MTETKQRRSKKPRKREPFLIDVTSPQYKEFQDDVALRTLYCEHTRRGEYLCGCCWLWGGSITWQGYAVYHIPKRLSSLFPPGMVTMSANRAAFLAFVQPYIAENFEIDHACHKDDGSCEPRTCTHRACVRPRHLTTMH